MKNIYLLPTDKPSRLCFRNYLFINKDNIGTYSNVEFKNIYITSNDEDENKDGEWYLIQNNKLGKRTSIQTYPNCTDGESHLCYEYIINGEKHSYHISHCKKIILTTDQKLIKDGVQAIDDEFLEWFVKNPSCENVEWSSEKIENSFDGTDWKFKYGTVIPHKKSKPHSFCETPEEKCTMNYCDDNGCQNRKRDLVELTEKQIKEKFEEAAEIEKIAMNKLKSKWEHLYTFGYPQKPFPTNYENDLNNVKIGLYEGAKWQAKRMYREDEVLQLLLRLKQTESYDNLYDWFTQFKKKN